MVRYRVQYHQGLLTDTDLETWLNGQASAGWRLVATIAVPENRQTGEPFRVLLVMETER